jgi:hypothetical protein
MPVASHPDPSELPAIKDPDDGWREPPGYLGEAVRRAKLIPRRASQSAPPKPSDTG